MKGTEAQIKFASDLMDKFTAKLLNWTGDECKTTIQWKKNCVEFLSTLTDDAHTIIEALKSNSDFRISIYDIREMGAKVWEEAEKDAKRSPVGMRRTMDMRRK